jgi:hypothetical protein
MQEKTLQGLSKRTGTGWIVCSGLILLILLLVESAPAIAQPRGVLRLFSGDMGRETPSLVYSGKGSAYSNVQKQPGKDLQIFENKVHLSIPIHQGPDFEWLLTGRMTAQAIRTEALLPSTAEAFPSHLWDLGFGTAYRKRFDNGWIGGATLDVGSASDKPFFSMDETTVSANLFTRIPHVGENAWLLLLNYNNNREFLPHVPIPGVGYLFQKNRRYRIAAGVPFVFGKVRPWSGDLSITFSYAPIRSVHAAVNYDLLRDLTVYGGFDWENDEFFRAQRRDKDWRLYYYEKRLAAGVRYQFDRRCFVDLSAGYAFDRMYFEGEKYSDNDFNRLDLDDGPFARIRIGLRY